MASGVNFTKEVPLKEISENSKNLNILPKKIRGRGRGSRSQLGILRAFSRKMVANESQNNFAIFFPEKGRILHFAVGRRAQGARRFLPKAQNLKNFNAIFCNPWISSAMVMATSIYKTRGGT